MPRRPPRILSIEDGQIVVAGTSDFDQARQVVAADGAMCLHEPTVFEVHSCTPSRGFVRWYRVIPANYPDPCGGDHEHHLLDAKRGERGAFAAVVLS
jgi:hypothetical protein